MRHLINAMLRNFGLRLVKRSNAEPTQLSKDQVRSVGDLGFLSILDDALVVPSLRVLPKSTGQLRQDVFALGETGFKRGGFFVEFGAANGIDMSNTYMLETDFGWDGIVAEPAQKWRAALQENRRCAVEFDCVWTVTGETLNFHETDIAVLSTLEIFKDREDGHLRRRARGKTYPVKTVSLVDLLQRHNAPREIDYLSIDTEGSELAILRAFDFDRYVFRVITVEHNGTEDRQAIFELLTSKGYRRKHESVSHFDDWYVLDR